MQASAHLIPFLIRLSEFALVRARWAGDASRRGEWPARQHSRPALATHQHRLHAALVPHSLSQPSVAALNHSLGQVTPNHVCAWLRNWAQ